MAKTITAQVGVAHPVLPDIGRPVMAKVNVRTPDIAWNVAVGRAIQRAVSLAGLSNKEAAGKVGVDDAEFGKWLNGSDTRHPHLDRLFAVDELRQPLVIALAELAEGVEVVTEIRVRRQVA